MNPAAWIENARSFIRSLRASTGDLGTSFRAGLPTRADQVSRVEAALGLKLPPEVVQFFTEGADSVDFHYAWGPSHPEDLPLVDKLTGRSVISGGYRIGPLQAMVDERWSVAEDFDCANKTLARDLRGLVPVIHYGTGSQICLDLRNPAAGAPLVFLGKDCMWEADWTWHQIAKNFNDFMEHWESIKYLHVVDGRHAPVQHEDWKGQAPTYERNVELIFELMRDRGVVWS